MTQRFDVHPLKPGLSAELRGIDLSRPLDGESRAALIRAYTDFPVLRLRDQDISDADLITFGKAFGKLVPPHPNPYDGKPFLPDYPELNVISNVKVDGKPIGNLGAGEAAWHTDMSYQDVPPSGSVLYALELPTEGGETSFCDMYGAYETLPKDVLEKIQGRVCIHDSSRNSAGGQRREYTEVTDPRQTPGARHPLVRRHPVSGRPCLFLGRRRNAYIPDLPLEESEELLDFLWDHATKPALVWAQEWRIGDVIVWDNRCVMHRREAFEENARRVMHRAQIAGEAVIAA